MRAILLAAVFLVGLNTSAQEAHHDTTHKNTIRINITPMLITGLGSSTLGYERVLWKRQTISANLGHLQLPPVISTPDGSPVEWVSSVRNTGMIASVDYRFYFSRNKYAVPDGLYWGPYATFYYIDNAAEINLFENQVFDGGARVQTYASMLMVGLQLGYQFVLWKRWTLDFIVAGPAVGFYDLKMRIKAQGDINEENEDYLQGVYDAIVSIFPGAATLFEEQEISSSGSTRFNSIGYRYLVQIGFRF